MDVITPIPLDQIDTRGRIRSPSPEQVESLKQSILTIGLLNPITVCHVAGRSYKLIAGGNRLEACRAAGYTEVPANVVDLTAPEAVIAECDENLCGPNLSAAERALFTAKRKEAYEEIYPAVSHGGNNSSPSGQFVHTDFPSFAEETARSTGKDERTVRRDAERGEKVIPEALGLIKGTKLDTGVYLDKLKSMPPNEQLHVVKRDLAVGRQEQTAERSDKAPEKKLPTYEEMRAAIYILCDLTPQDFLRLCPPDKRTPMCSRLAHLVKTFDIVREEAVR